MLGTILVGTRAKKHFNHIHRLKNNEELINYIDTLSVLDL